ncbi:MAG: tetratricopeptide repeat protein [Magnetococcus sp. MYC-9]
MAKPLPFRTPQSLPVKHGPPRLIGALLALFLGATPLQIAASPTEGWATFVDLALSATTPQAFQEADTLLQKKRQAGAPLEPGNQRLAWSLARMARFHHRQQNLIQAETCQTELLQLLEARLGSSDLLLVQPLGELAAIQFALSRLSLARLSLERALTIVETAANPGHLLLVRILEQLAEIHRIQERPQEAERLQQRMTEIQEQALTMETPGDAIILARQAKAHLQKDREEQAVPLLQQSKEILMESSGPYHSARVEVLTTLAHIMFHDGEYAQAIELYKSALAISENMRGSHHPELLPLLKKLATGYQKVGKPNLSRPVIVRSLALVEEWYGTAHERTAEVLLDLADNLRMENQPDPAVDLYNRSITLLRQQEKATTLARALSGLARAQQMQGKGALALRTLQEVSEILSNTLGPDHLEYQIAHRFHGELLKEQEEKQRDAPANFALFAQQWQSMKERLLSLGGILPIPQGEAPPLLIR